MVQIKLFYYDDDVKVETREFCRLTHVYEVICNSLTNPEIERIEIIKK